MAHDRIASQDIEHRRICLCTFTNFHTLLHSHSQSIEQSIIMPHNCIYLAVDLVAAKRTSLGLKYSRRR